MRVIVTRQFLNGTEVVTEGTEIAVTQRRGEQLLARGLVQPARSELGSGNVRTQTRRAARPAGTANPTPAAAETSETSTRTSSRRTGGRTGAARQQSSSRQARQRSTRRSKAQEAEPASSR